MTVRIPLPDNLYHCPQPWINFIEHCQSVVFNNRDERLNLDKDIERYVDTVLLEKYLSVLVDEEECVIFADDSLYTLFMLEWS